MTERLVAFLLAIALFLVSSCKDEGGKAAPAPTGAGGQSTGGEQAAVVKEPGQTETPKAPTGAAVAEKADHCLAMLGSWDKEAYRDCFAAKAEVVYVDNIPPQPGVNRDEAVVRAGMFRNAFGDFKAERQLVLTRGNRWLLVAHLSGKHQGTSLGFPPSGKPLDILWAEIAELGADGRIERQRNYVDLSTVLHQLGVLESESATNAEKPWGPPMLSVAADDEAERSNLAAVKSALEALGRADVPGTLAMYAEDAVFRYIPEAKAYTGRKEIADRLGSYIAISDRFTVALRDSWAAGEWVVAELTTSGTLSSDLPDAKGTKGKRWEQNSLELFRLASGKVNQHWTFANGLKFAADVGLIDPDPLAGPPPEEAQPASGKSN